MGLEKYAPLSFFTTQIKHSHIELNIFRNFGYQEPFCHEMKAGDWETSAQILPNSLASKLRLITRVTKVKKKTC